MKNRTNSYERALEQHCNVQYINVYQKNPWKKPWNNQNVLIKCHWNEIFVWDFCLIIKFKPYLETLPTFFMRAVSENCFSSFLKMAGWAQKWWPSSGRITLMLCWKFRLIVGEETSVLVSQKTIFRTSQNCKTVNNSSLTHCGGGESILWPFSLSNGYFQDILGQPEQLSVMRSWKQF